MEQKKPETPKTTEQTGQDQAIDQLTTLDLEDVAGGNEFDPG